MTVALVNFGSVGDVYPMLALGQLLQQAGHRPVVLTNPVFAGMVERAGLAFCPVGTAQDHQRTLAHLKLWHPVDGLGVMWRYLLEPALAPSLQALEALRTNGLRAVVAGCAAFGARVFTEATGLPLLTVYTAATMLRSLQHPTTLAAWRVGAWFPRRGLRWAWQWLDRHKLDPLVLPALNAQRARWGVPALKGGVFAEWMHSPDGGLALFPEWFAPARTDWPGRVVQTGFMLHEPGSSADLSAGLRAFLAAGEAPVVFTLGTAQVHAQDVRDTALHMVQALGGRAVMLGEGWGASGPCPGNPLAWVEPFSPLGPLLSRARAVVHHGGVGTCAEAMRAGLPQLVLASAYDQFDNAMRLEHLGVGVTLPMRQASLTRMKDGLMRTLTLDAGPMAECASRLAALQPVREATASAMCSTLSLPVKGGG